MEKLVFVVRRRDGVEVTDTAASCVELGAELAALGALDVGVNVIAPDIHRAYMRAVDMSGVAESMLPSVAAVLSLWVDCVDCAPQFVDAFERAGCASDGYLVTESVPMRQPRTWPLGEPAPGISLVTVLDRPPRLDSDTFLRHWTTVHTPMSLQWIPLVGYVRNHVARPLTAGAPSCAGIVEEMFAVVEDLIDPSRFFGTGGNAELLMQRATAMGQDVQAFLDLDRVEAFAMHQVCISE